MLCLNCQKEGHPTSWCPTKGANQSPTTPKKKESAMNYVAIVEEVVGTYN